MLLKALIYQQTDWENIYPYIPFWIRNKNDPAVLQYIKEENKYGAAIMKHTSDLQTTLYSEFLGSLPFGTIDEPILIGNYYYYKKYSHYKVDYYNKRNTKKNTKKSTEQK